MPKISIITVVYNNAAYIEKTIQSVVNQTYQNKEYLVIDGGSTDGTLSFINSYLNQIDYFISEKDKGIYDAMNKGIERCTGDWMIFLNSGDVFYDSNTLAEAISIIKGNEEAAVIYGDVIGNFLKSGSYLIKAKDIAGLKNEMVMNHQACFIKAEIQKRFYYDLKYKITADYDFFLKCFYSGEKFIQANITVSNILAGGLSDANRISSFYEAYVVKMTHEQKILSPYIYFIKKASTYLVTKGIKAIVPQFLIGIIYKFKYSR